MNTAYGSQVNIAKIQSTKVRNFLRGIINVSETDKVKKTLNKIRSISDQSDYLFSVDVLRENNLFKNNTFERDFNKICPKGIPSKIVTTKEHIIDKIKANESKICILLDMYLAVTKEIQLTNFQAAVKHCLEIVDSEGVSCVFIKILFYIKIHAEKIDDKQLEISIDDIFQKIEIENVEFLRNAIRELSSPRTDYFNICSKINATDENLRFNFIVRNFISPVLKSERQYINTMNEYYSFSLLDAFLYISNTNRLGLFFGQDTVNFSNHLNDKYSAIGKIKLNLNLYSDSEDGLNFNLFRESFLLIEMEDFFRYKTTLGSLYNTDESKEENRIPFEMSLISDYFSNVKTLKDLKISENGMCGISLHKFNSSSCGFLENTCALMCFIEKKDADISSEESTFIELMSHTMSVGDVCPTHYLSKLNDNANSNSLKLVMSCLISIKEKSQLSDHSLRKTIQDIMIEDGKESLKDLLEFVYKISPSVTLHLIHTCDETFLSKLFHVVSKPNEAIVERSKILEWYGLVTKDYTYIERAKNLIIDVQINKEKETIDDSRIYVDPLRFSQWINDHILNEMSLLLDFVADDEIASISIEWEKAKSGISYNEQIASLLLKSYKEFCDNNIFGIASYLGRRIRHGTFKGKGLKEVEDLLLKENYRDIFNNRDFSEGYDSWFISYEEMLDELKENNLHIKSRNKPLGLISSDFDTKFKRSSANRLYVDVVKSYKKMGIIWRSHTS